MNVALYDLIRKSRMFSAIYSVIMALWLTYVFYTESPRLSIYDFIFYENASGQFPMFMWGTLMVASILWCYPVSISIMASLKKGMTTDEITRCD